MLNLRRLTAPLTLTIALFAAASASAAVSSNMPCVAGATTAVARLAAPSALNSGGVRVCSPADLAATLNSTYSGRIIIPRDVFWDMTAYKDLPVKNGVEIVGERGALGSRPTLHMGDRTTEYSLFVVTGNSVHINGIHFMGPKPPSTHAQTDPYENAILVIEDFDAKTGRNILIDDNEFDRWAGAGVNVTGPADRQVDYPKDWDPSWAKPVPSDAALVRINNNDMHDNNRDGGGYGVTLDGDCYATVEGNVFNNNRHSVAASGRAYSGYIAKFNYVLHTGTKQGGYYNQHFDVHGRQDNGYGGPAGTYFDISFNTVLGAQSYYVVKTRPVLMLRGRPELGMYFHDNVVEHDDLDSAVALTTGGLSGLGIGEDEGAFNFHSSGDTFNTDHSREIAHGDFDGDGQQDVFVASGTAWWYSKAGVRSWQLLHESTKLTRDLAFDDINNDGKTDILYRDGAGNLGFLSGGSAALVPLTTLPVPITALRFGDFDGDGRQDMFYTRNGQWYVWYGATHAWKTTATSSMALGNLLFGDFDGVRGTDVVSVVNGAWSLSSGSTGSWQRLNAKLTGSFDNAVVGDFDGDGRDDIAVGSSSSWSYSRSGNAPLVTMRTGSSLSSLKAVQIGRFNTGPKVIAVAFVGDRLAQWKGVGAASAFYTRSLQDMR